MFATAATAAVYGMEVRPIQVEADVSDGMPVFLMVGYASSQVKEAMDRVRTALHNSGIRLPPKRITVNLSPVDIRKSGAVFDLPVAASILAACNLLPEGRLSKMMMAGELSLSGEVRPVHGILPMVLKARELGCTYCMVPSDNMEEARLVKDVPVIGVRTVGEMMEYVRHPENFRYTGENRTTEKRKLKLDFSDIAGQESAKRAAEIAVSGFHNFLMIGPPGAGKTMLAKRIPSIMPPLSFEEQLELTKIYSIAGLLNEKAPMVTDRPFRSPHHTCSAQALTGGGYNPRPGEISLAHRGILFLDEMPEFSRRVLETLRQPMEDRQLILARASGTFCFPADFMMVAAMNPCPCGMYPEDACSCSPGEISHYVGKVSQPLLDRMDLCVDIPAVSFDQMTRKIPAESSKTIRERVLGARERQQYRFRGENITFNSEIPANKMDAYCRLGKKESILMENVYTKMHFSVRAYHKILKVSRTIADLDQSEHIGVRHISEALTFRAMDRKNRG